MCAVGASTAVCAIVGSVCARGYVVCGLHECVENIFVICVSVQLLESHLLRESVTPSQLDRTVLRAIYKSNITETRTKSCEIWRKTKVN